MQQQTGSARPRLLAAALIACAATGTPRAAPPARDATSAVANLDVAAGLEATLFAAEPDIANVTCLDVDHRGRVWIGDVRNYRRRNGSRPEGDRILVLEDADRDGTADKVTVFHQGRDIDSVHGLCVLGSRVIVSAGDSVRVFHDDDGDLVADRQEPLFTGIGGAQHDHGIHAVVFGPDGRLYFNFGNEGHRLRDKAGKPVIDRAGNEVSDARRPYQQGMVFRCRLDGSDVETLGWNFRNNWKLAVDSFGTIWQSDNDDDGNQGVRINYVMEFGNYGYRDELTGAGWNQPRTNMEQEIPRRHWHLDDPGVVPTLLLTGAGSPTGICVYEGTLLPERFRGQPIHCDAGPSVCRAYVTRPTGAGFSAEVVDILRGARDNWFRPSDVAVAPDGALFVADWYDPGVGGHAQGEVDKGRVFRVAPPGATPVVPEHDFTTPAGAAAALASPNGATRALAWIALERLGDAARPAVEPLWTRTGDDRLRARALWFLGGRPGADPAFVDRAIRDPSADIRVVALRAARAAGRDPIPLVRALVADECPAVRRECAIALRHCRAPEAPALWAQLALAHDGRDRWYLEALGIGADGAWDACLDAYVAAAGTRLLDDAGKEIIWRSRAKRTPELLVRVLGDAGTPAAARPRFMRAFDFLPQGPEKDAALQALLTLE